MAKNLNISVLYDFYGEMLTDKQKEVIELYYNEDLSLAEIAQNSGITRQGVRDSIKRAEAQLLECEEKLGLWARFVRIQESLGEIIRHADCIQKCCARAVGAEEVRRHSQSIIDLAGSLNI